MFDDALLDEPDAWGRRGAGLERLALAGARLRREGLDEASSAQAQLAQMGAGRPRSVLVAGEGASLIQAAVGGVAPVPVVAWKEPVLPAWAGPLDLVIVLCGGGDRWFPLSQAALRRGSLLLVVAPPGSSLPDEMGPAVMVVTREDDRLVAALLVMAILAGLGLGPAVDLAAMADELDAVAARCGPVQRLGANPAKDLACALAEAVPLLWGGSPLAAEAARQVATALGQATGRPALAGDEAVLTALIERSQPRDLFSDPFEDASPAARFVLLVFDDSDRGSAGAGLIRAAERRRVRLEPVAGAHGSALVRYVGLLQQGLFAAAYLEAATMEER